MVSHVDDTAAYRACERIPSAGLYIHLLYPQYSHLFLLPVLLTFQHPFASSPATNTYSKTIKMKTFILLTLLSSLLNMVQSIAVLARGNSARAISERGALDYAYLT